MPGLGITGIIAAGFPNFGFVSTATSSVSTTTYSFSQSIGTASPDRLVVAAVSDRWSGAGLTAPAVTIGGVSASQVAYVNSNSVISIGLFSANVPLGTTATITAIFNIAATGVGCSTWALYDLNSFTANSTASANGASPQTLSVNTTNGSVVIAADASTSGNYTWSGLTQRGNITVFGSMTMGIADAQETVTQLPRAINVTSAGSFPVGVSANWR